jgi:hypothetical protein
MALPVGTFFEVWPTSGNDANGGGWVPGSSGTNYSQQSAAQYTNTDLAVDATTNTKVTSAGHSFVSADVGNLIHITAGSGYTLGFYEIVSVASGAATLDRSPGATSTTGGTYAVGGALATISAAKAGAIAGNTVWCKATGTYTVTTALSCTTQNGNPITFVGYTATHGDNGQVTWTTSTNSINLIEAGSGNPWGWAFFNFNFTNTAGTPGDCFHAKSSVGQMFHARNCIMNGFRTGVYGNYSVDYSFLGFLLENCIIENATVDGIFVSDTVVVLGGSIHNCGGQGIRMNMGRGGASRFVVAVDVIIRNNTGAGIRYDGTDSYSYPVIVNCDIYENADGVNIDNAGSAGGIVCWNTILDSNSAYAFNMSNSTGFQGIFSFITNALRNNTSGNYNNTPGDVSDTDVILSASPFTSPTTDMSLNSTSGGGAACKTAATPSPNRDIGAEQSAGSGGGGGGAGGAYTFCS